jgi:hypothetical protein
MTTLTTTAPATAPKGVGQRVKQRKKRGERILHAFTWALIIWLALPIAVVILLIGIFSYAKVLGTEDVLEAAAVA